MVPEYRLFQVIWLCITSKQKHGTECNFSKNNFEHPCVNDLSWSFFYVAHEGGRDRGREEPKTDPVV